MAKILFINPNRWGRGITHIWLASHSGLIGKKHKIEFFDSSFFEDWAFDEVKLQTQNKNYKHTNYDNYRKFKKENVFSKLQEKVDEFNPDIIFWSAISSHIHGEGEYVNIQNGYDLVNKIDSKGSLKITAGLQATSAPEIILEKMPKIDFLIMGESEVILNKILNHIDEGKDFSKINGLAFKKQTNFVKNQRQEILENLDELTPYNYDIFDDEVFLRPYNGKLVRAVDYEMSRGCIYSCSYCVETIIQRYYSFTESSSSTGSIKNFKSYLRSKSPKNILIELKRLVNDKKIELIRCQDTNFLTNERKILTELADLILKENLKFKLYIETRPEGINQASIDLLKKLNVDGVGMGIELADEEFRELSLNRFASQSKTISAFELLRKNGIKRTAYNIIGLPNQNEESILKTIEFNKQLDPDNITVAFYSPYYGTKSQSDGKEAGIFDDYEFDVDSALRSKSKDTDLLPIDKLKFYKENFVKLVRNEI